MNCLPRSMLFGNQLPGLFVNSPSNQHRIPMQQMKMVSVVGLNFALLGALVYASFRKEIIVQRREEQNVVKKVAQDNLPLESKANHTLFETPLEKAAIFSMPSQELDERKAADVKDGEEGIVTAISDEQFSKDELCSQPTSDEISEIAEKAEQHLSPTPLPEIPQMPKIDYYTLFDDLMCETMPPPALRYTNRNCRFRDILCPERTRVQIQGKTEDLYLHANHVDLEGVHLILTQYPYPEQIPLFWQASKEACLILDLTNEKDMKRGLVPYAPKLNDDLQFEDERRRVRCLSQRKVNGINAELCTYSFEEIDSTSDMPVITRLHYENWEDHEGITEDDLDRLLAILAEYQKDSTIPIMVHCRAGVGRSGTVSVAYAISQLIKQNKADVSNLSHYIYHLILEGRRQRGECFVQTVDQLKAIWKWGWRAVHRAQVRV